MGNIARPPDEVASSSGHVARMLQHFGQQMTDCMFVADMLLRIRYIHPAAEAMFKRACPRAQFAGTPLADVIPGHAVTVVRSAVRRAQLAGEAATAAIAVRLAGKDLLLNTQAVPYRDHAGRVIEVLAFCRNATAWKPADLPAVLRAQILAARRDERNRLGRDLHDGPGQLAAALQMNLHCLLRGAKEWSAERVALYVQEMLSRCRELIDDIRWLSHCLHPAALGRAGLYEAVSQLLQRCQGDIQARLVTNSPEIRQCRFCQLAEDAAFRIIQEAVNNVIRHSQARKMTVRMDYRRGRLVCEVSDDGVGFDPRAGSGSGIGLMTMTERAQEAGGNVSIDSRPRRTQVRIIIPAALQSDQSDQAPS